MEENGQTTGKASKIIIGIIIAIAVAVGVFFLIKNLVCHRTYAKIIATNFVAYDLTRAVVGDSAEVTLLIEPGKDYHTYEPSADDKNAIKEADLFVFIGGESESWVYDIIGEDHICSHIDLALEKAKELANA